MLQQAYYQIIALNTFELSLIENNFSILYDEFSFWRRFDLISWK